MQWFGSGGSRIHRVRVGMQCLGVVTKLQLTEMVVAGVQGSWLMFWISRAGRYMAIGVDE